MPLPSTVAVLGLGLSGCATAEALLRRGVQVIAADEKPLDALSARERVRHLAEQGVELVLGAGAFERLRQWRLPLAIISPGICVHRPDIQALVQAGTELWSEVELGYRLLMCERGEGTFHLIAITGTKGKTTTAYLTAAMLQASGLPTVLAGNVGVPLVCCADEHKGATHFVVEVSSFQLATCHTFRPAIAALTMLSVDHLDWHQSVDEYWNAKAKLFAHQRYGDDWVVLNADDAGSRWMAGKVRTRILWCGKEVMASCVYCTHWVSDDGAFLWANLGEGKFPVLRLVEFPLPGEHNKSNLRIAAGTALLAGAAPDRIADAVRDFKGVPHRLEFVAEVNGVRFFNDSAATMPDAAAAATRAFSAPVILIAGGRDKGGRWDSFAAAIKGRVKALIALGEFAERLMDIAHHAGVPTILRASDMDDAVQQAMALAQRGDVVLLSPGCASFDQFANYAQRGEAFKAAVRRLTATTFP